MTTYSDENKKSVVRVSNDFMNLQNNSLYMCIKRLMGNRHGNEIRFSNKTGIMTLTNWPLYKCLNCR